MATMFNCVQYVSGEKVRQTDRHTYACVCAACVRACSVCTCVLRVYLSMCVCVSLKPYVGCGLLCGALTTHDKYELVVGQPQDLSHVAWVSPPFTREFWSLVVSIPTGELHGRPFQIKTWGPRLQKPVSSAFESCLTACYLFTSNSDEVTLSQPCWPQRKMHFSRNKHLKHWTAIVDRNDSQIGSDLRNVFPCPSMPGWNLLPACDSPKISPAKVPLGRKMWEKNIHVGKVWNLNVTPNKMRSAIRTVNAPRALLNQTAQTS